MLILASISGITADKFECFWSMVGEVAVLVICGEKSPNEVWRFCSLSLETDLAATFASKWVSWTTVSA